jgi:tetratricopeptide (TPR) repeat protein
MGVLADEKRDCRESTSHDARIEACSASIDRNPNDAAAYYTRGVAYQFKGEIDRAISDFEKAIELNPYHTAAYDGRGRAYANKGDYTKAVADVTKASELTQSSAPEPKKVTAEPALAKTTERTQEQANTLAPASAVAVTKEGDLQKNTQRKPQEMKTVAHPAIAKKQDGTLNTAREPKEVQTVRKPPAVANTPAPKSSLAPWPAWVPQDGSGN